MGVLGLVILFIFYIVLAFIIESVGMEKIIPLKFKVERRQNINSQLLEINPTLNLESIFGILRNAIFCRTTFAEILPTSANISWTRAEIPLEQWWSKVRWNLQKFWNKKACPVSLSVTNDGDIIYTETEEYKIACFNLICCDDTTEVNDGKVLDINTGEERFPLEEGDAFSRTFKCWIAISTQSYNHGKEYKGYLFSSKKWLQSVTKVSSLLFEQVFNLLDYDFSGSLGIDRQRVSRINNSIKEIIIGKNTVWSIMGGTQEEELYLEFHIKKRWKLSFFNPLSTIKQLLWLEDNSTPNFTMVNDFRRSGLSEENIRIITQNWSSNPKTLNLDIEWEELIAFTSQEVATTANSFSLEDYSSYVTSYLSSLQNA